MSQTRTDLSHNRFPILLNNHKVFIWIAKKDGFIYRIISFGDTFPVFVGHNQDSLTFMPKVTCFKYLLIFGHVIDDITHQTFFCPNAGFRFHVRRCLQFYTRFRKIRLRFAIRRISKPAFLQNSADSSLPSR